jgi:putative transposase
MGRGIQVGHGQVELLMRRAGLAGVVGRPRWRRIKPDNIASDRVQRNFQRAHPNQLRVTDITEHRTREGKVYCCVVLDTFSRKAVGWSIDASPTAALVTNALGMAIDSRLTHPRRGLRGAATLAPTTQCCNDRLNPVNLHHGPSPTGPRHLGWCRRWEAWATPS